MPDPVSDMMERVTTLFPQASLTFQHGQWKIIEGYGGREITAEDAPKAIREFLAFNFTKATQSASSNLGSAKMYLRTAEGAGSLLKLLDNSTNVDVAKVRAELDAIEATLTGLTDDTETDTDA